jgi:membrane glycosyltransferase
LVKHGFTGGRRFDAESTPAPVSFAAPALPAETPLDMPRAPLHRLAMPLRRGRRSVAALLSVGFSRLYVAIGSAALIAYGIHEMYGVMATSRITVLQWAFLVVFAVNFSWVSIAFVQTSLGFVRRALMALWQPRPAAGAPTIRTAVLVPVYNEDAGRVAAAIRAMAEPLGAIAPGRFAFFVLSDTNRADTWVGEEAVFRRLTAEMPAGCPVYYRHRNANTERKAGNIADWVQRWGGAYEAMLILDADSVMTPETMVELAHRLEADPGLGLIQTLPAIVNGTSLYGRLQQFANRCYGPIFGHGLAAWHGLSGNYWGHNAIIRTRAFADSCRLPELSGRPPFGGHVLSHDFVEAALLRRDGWGVRIDTDLHGSYEEAPPSLIDVMIRDRRWCQGNLQHARFLFARGLSMPSRLHLLSGIMSYVTALLWLLLLALGLALAAQATLIRPEYFTEPSLFPTWPVFDTERAISLFVVSMLVVMAPKMFGLLSAALNIRRFLAFGGPVTVTWSVFVEALMSALYAPILMMSQARDVVSVLLGRDGGWKPQRRGDGSIPFREHVHRHQISTLVGLCIAVGAWNLNTDLFWWLSPVTFGLMLSIPLSVMSGAGGFARALVRVGILSTPEDRRPPAVLDAVRTRPDAESGPDPRGVLSFMARNPTLCQWHAAQLAEPDHGSPDSFDPALVTGLAKSGRVDDIETLENWLTPAETLAVLGHRSFVTRLPLMPAGGVPRLMAG